MYTLISDDLAAQALALRDQIEALQSEILFASCADDRAETNGTLPRLRRALADAQRKLDDLNETRRIAA